MKKISFMILIIALAATFTLGCSDKETSAESQGEYKLEEIQDLEKIPKELNSQLELLSRQRGYLITEYKENEFIFFISLGEKRTGGYDIIGKDVSLEDSGIIVTFEEIEPDGPVTQVITYPYKVFLLTGKINDIGKVKVENNHGEQLQVIKLEANPLVTGEYIGQADTHSVEIIINGQAKTFEINQVKDLLDSLNLNTGSLVKISFEENEDGQLILQSIKKADDGSQLPEFDVGIFMGQIDSHSIEIMLNKEVKAFQIIDVLDRFEELNLQEGDMIKFTYIEDENSMLVIKSIETEK